MEERTEPPLRRILVLDDDRDYRKLLLAFLRSTFPEAEALEYDPAAAGVPGEEFDWSRFDLLLLDYNLHMAGITGLEILQAHHEHPDFPATIMLTGAGDEDVAVRAFRSGVQDYLRKERLKKTQLSEAILAALARRRAQRERLDVLEGVRATARREASRVVEEYRTRFDDIRGREENRLMEELARLEKELQRKQQILDAILAEKQAAEEGRQAAEREVSALRVRLETLGTGDAATVKSLQQELAAANDKLARLKGELSTARRKQEHVEAELHRTGWNKEQEQMRQQNLQEDLASFNRELEEQAGRDAQVSAHLQRMRDIKAKARSRQTAGEKARERSLLGDVENLLQERKNKS